MAKSVAKWNAGFEKFRADHPGATFAEYYVAGAVAKIRDGRKLASLGPSLRPNAAGAKSDYATAGASTFRHVAELAALKPEHRMVDYGCGSLRVGLHFIEFLNPGNYFGLDVTTDFIDIGKDLIGAKVLGEKRPQFAAINEASVSTAAAFGPDLVLSNAVCYHVHPDETALYFGNLRRVAGKRGAVLLFKVMIAAAPARYHKSGWAWPLDFYIECLKPLAFVGTHREWRVTDDRAKLADMTGAMLEFRAD